MTDSEARLRRAGERGTDAALASFVPAYASSETPLVRFIITALTRAYGAISGPMASIPLLRRSLLRHDFLFFVLLSSAFLVLAPRYSLILYHGFQKIALPADPGPLDTSAVPYVPNAVPILLAAFLATFFAPRRLLLPLAFLFSAVALFSSYLQHPFHALSGFAGFFAVVYLIVRSPMPRWAAFVTVTAFSVLSLLAAHQLPSLRHSQFLTFLSHQQLLIPMLWYSVYSHDPPRTHLPVHRFALYHWARWFHCPVFRYSDIFPEQQRDTEAINQTRFEGIKALIVVVLSASAIWLIQTTTHGIDSQALNGPALLGYSYLIYVTKYFAFVIPVNTFIGGLRLFGIPIRNNFNYWLLARTPNEHWRRWNVLYREWVITFAFFPIMRAKRWIFVAVMACLLITGVLHLAHSYLAHGVTWFFTAKIMTYWALNGLAIYLVIKIPILFPNLVKRLRIGGSKLWAVTGVVLTSAFYAVLVYLRASVQEPADLADYFSRLFCL